MSNSKCAGIYSITSKVSGKRYIGSSVRICMRWTKHLTDLRTGKHCNSHLQNHYNKYGKEDLLFNVIEVIERNKLSLQEFKQLLLDKEQIYLNNWKECHFNIKKNAATNLGFKRKNPKNYYFKKSTEFYIVYFQIERKVLNFGYHKLELNAINEVEYLRDLSEEDKLVYYNNNYNKRRGGSKVGQICKNSKGYYFNKSNNKWRVVFTVNKKRKDFGFFFTEEEAKEKALQIKEELNKLNEFD